MTLATAMSLAIAPVRGHRLVERARSRTCGPAQSGRALLACRAVVCAASGEQEVVSGVVFQPFSEVKGELAVVSDDGKAVPGAVPTRSLARAGYSEESEAAVNEQINIEYNISYVYHSLFAYFDRDNVGLPGLAKYFQNASEDEREHAEMLMRFQNIRGGRVKLQSIIMPEMEFDHAEKGEALYAMELALSLEKLNFHKLRHLHDVAAKNNDAQMCDFVEAELLQPQARDIKEVAIYVSQLRRVGKGHGVYHFDKDMREKLGVEDVAEVA